ncbi:MAG: hypothetical protein LQ340_003305 [Diploschistes diacapsis]|nr:MAG: hypothetical protein LQ340_003305 [Diploschistes diacapsis]
MPLATLHLLKLTESGSVPTFIQRLQKTPSVNLILASQPQYAVIEPTKLDSQALSSHYDLLILVETPNAALPEELRSAISSEYKVTVGVPSRILKDYHEHNAQLWNEAAEVKLTGSLDKARERAKKDAQNLEVSPDLLRFMDDLTQRYGDKPVTMLNLLWFTEDGKPSYAKYGQAFKEVAGKRGGDAKLVGNVVAPPQGASDSRGDFGRPAQEWWNEFSLVHYPR